MHGARTAKVTEKSGCIEDRTFEGAEHGERNQVPGADLFFSFLRDVQAVEKDGTPTHNTLLETVLKDVKRLGRKYTVHNDADHGEVFDGCGFAAKLADILADLQQNIDEIISGLNFDESEESRARELADAAGKLGKHKGYLEVTGGVLVKKAHEAGAGLLTYSGNHAAKELTIDRSEGSTYDSARTHADSASTPVFNVDSNYAYNYAVTFGLDPETTAVFAEVASLATVRVLSNKQIAKAVYI